MRLHIWHITFGLCFVLFGTTGHARLLVTSTQPLYLIAQAVTQGVEQPTLLIPANQDGHHIQIRPEDRKTLQQADLVIWVGAEYEAALVQLLRDHPNAVALSAPAHRIQRLVARELDGQPRPNTLDPHLWLSPYNAVFTAHLIANLRAAQYPEHAVRYRQNAQAFTERLVKAVGTVPPHGKPYWAYHDAYQYIERYAGVRLAAALTADPELPPTAKQIQWLRQHRPSTTPCILTEGHAPRALIQRLMPVNHVLIDETMRDAKDFISGWTTLRDRIQLCVGARD